MNKKVKLRPGQSYFDIAIQEYGALDAIALLLDDNPDITALTPIYVEAWREMPVNYTVPTTGNNYSPNQDTYNGVIRHNAYWIKSPVNRDISVRSVVPAISITNKKNAEKFKESILKPATTIY